MVLFAQIAAVAQLLVTVADAVRGLPTLSHGSTTLALLSPLAQMTWLRLRGRPVASVQLSALLLSLTLGLWATAIPPAAGFGLAVFKVLVGAAAWSPQCRGPAPLKRLKVLPTSRAVFGERMS